MQSSDRETFVLKVAITGVGPESEIDKRLAIERLIAEIDQLVKRLLDESPSELNYKMGVNRCGFDSDSN